MNIPHQYTVAESFSLLVLSLTAKILPPVLLSGFGFIGLLFLSFGSKVASRLHCALFALLSCAVSSFILEIYALTAMVGDWWGTVQVIDNYHVFTGIRSYYPTEFSRLMQQYRPVWVLSCGLHVASYLLFLWAACELVINSSMWDKPTAFSAWGPFLFLAVPVGTLLYSGLTSSILRDIIQWFKH